MVNIFFCVCQWQSCITNYHCKVSLKKVRTQVLFMFKSCYMLEVCYGPRISDNGPCWKYRLNVTPGTFFIFVPKSLAKTFENVFFFFYLISASVFVFEVFSFFSFLPSAVSQLKKMMKNIYSKFKISWRREMFKYEIGNKF